MRARALNRSCTCGEQTTNPAEQIDGVLVRQQVGRQPARGLLLADLVLADDDHVAFCRLKHEHACERGLALERLEESREREDGLGQTLEPAVRWRSLLKLRFLEGIGGHLQEFGGFSDDLFAVVLVFACCWISYVLRVLLCALPSAFALALPDFFEAVAWFADSFRLGAAMLSVTRSK